MTAAIVTAGEDIGGLLITGDDLANGVLVTQVGVGQYKVTGQTAGGSPTTINGAASAVISGAKTDIDFDMRGGSDSLEVRGVTINGDLGFDTGIGGGIHEIDRIRDAVLHRELHRIQVVAQGAAERQRIAHDPLAECLLGRRIAAAA